MTESQFQTLEKLKDRVFVRTIVNDFGEPIHIKIDNGDIFIHHEDATRDYLPLNHFLFFYSISPDELTAIYKTIKKMSSIFELIIGEYLEAVNKTI
jgi:hypothetical protein